ncbi:DUF5642 family protein [Mycolicibacterium hodleri]|uniref:DUF5642 domain-containing protein n=1 Tax=Mycolicibacterium hodleri TaxID=49897 RepID=A0A502EFM9_9MYCO|nr:DUF5642 family protein [Mycolicibacterium hodleri]TPG35792.1 hypothetical protein EAH80_06970 [Mycolicibacterium hodleri]
MRVFASCVAIALCAACGQSATPAAPGAAVPTSTAVVDVDPARVDRVRAALPTGYEFSALPDRAAPVALWGFGPAWTAEPSACGSLADPAGLHAVHGWSASGVGGIVYAVVADETVGLDQSLVDTCGTWRMSAGHTRGVVTLVHPPAIDGAATVGMITDATTTVEGGIETHSHAQTFIAYLDDHAASVTVVIDPGSSAPSLGEDVASDLLVKAVAAIRG